PEPMDAPTQARIKLCKVPSRRNLRGFEFSFSKEVSHTANSFLPLHNKYVLSNFYYFRSENQDMDVLGKLLL
uniref:hypothetical protein n=1 Tax=Candidatus Igneacidithiobacillus taiwanensis TaxID=1945924 RepID=UPI0028A0C7D3